MVIIRRVEFLANIVAILLTTPGYLCDRRLLAALSRKVHLYTCSMKLDHWASCPDLLIWWDHRFPLDKFTSLT